MRSLSIFFGIFAGIGAICFVLSGYFAYTSLQKSSWEEARGTISRFRGDYPVISFSYNGKLTEFRANYTSSGMAASQEVVVFFPPGQPAQAQIKSFFTLWFLPLFLSIFWLVFGGIGFIGLTRQLGKMKMKRELFIEKRGKRVLVPIAEVTQDFSYKVNGRSPFIIVCQYHDAASNTIYQFKSDYIWYNPSQFLNDKKELDVYVDPRDFTRYYLDTGFLPKKIS